MMCRVKTMSILVCLLTACLPGGDPPAGSRFRQLVNEAREQIREIEGNQVADMLAENPATVILDVREADEFVRGHYPGSVHLSKGVLEWRIERVVSDPSTPLILYCGGGNRSALAALNLARMGYSNVSSVRRGSDALRRLAWVVNHEPDHASDRPALPAPIRDFFDAYNRTDGLALRSLVRTYGGIEDPEERRAVERQFVDRWIRAHRIIGPVEVHSVAPNPEGGFTVWTRGHITRAWMGVHCRFEPGTPQELNTLRVIATARPGHVPMPDRLSAADLAEYLDAYLQPMREADLFSGVVLVTHNGQPVYEFTSGYADQQKNIRNTMTTRFDIASVSKVFVALAALALVEDGRLSFDETLDHFVPEYPHHIARQISVGHLLRHTHGIKLDYDDDYMTDIFSVRSAGGFIDLQIAYLNKLDAYATFERPNEFVYSNEGYDLLAAIIEAVTGEDYFDFVQRRILESAGLQDTGPYDASNAELTVAQGYTNLDSDADFVPGPTHSNRSYLFAAPRPAGGFYSTAIDLGRLVHALNKGRVVSPTTWAAMREPTSTRQKMPHFQLTYGTGLDVYRFEAGDIVGHGGGRPGASARVDLFPASGYTVVVLANYDWVSHTIAEHLQEVMPIR